MKHLLRLVALRYLKASPARTLLTLFGILLGVAVIFAIDVVNRSVLESFHETIDDVAGRTALQVGDGTGVPESLLDTVKGVEGVEAAVPVIQESARDVKSGEQLAILGVDTLSDSKVRDYDVTAADAKITDDLAFLNDPHGVLVTDRYAERRGVRAGDVLTLETVEGKQDFTVRGTLAARGPAKVFGGDLLLMDVYAAQIAFGRDKRFDRIDVVPAKGTDTTALAARIEDAIAHRATVTRPQRRSEETERILAGFRMGLSLASLVAIFVGGFIVYNALAIAVAQRRREIGILRALGATRAMILALFIGEGLVMGGIGSVLGLGFGLLLARGVLGVVGSSISDLYVRVRPEGLSITPQQLVLGVLAGVTASFVAAFFPARRAAFIEPAAAMRKKVEAADITLGSNRASLAAGLATALVAVAVAWVAHVRENYLLGYGVAAILSFAAAFLSPVLARGVGAVARRVAVRIGPAVRLGADAFDRNAGRNAVTIAALGMALANVVNVAAFLHSMKQNTVGWFERSIRSDVFVFAGHEVKAKFEHPIPSSIGEGIATYPGVEFVNPFRMVKDSVDGQPIYRLAYDLERYEKYNQIPVVEGDLARATREAASGEGVWVSESFSRFHHAHVGDSLTLQTPDGPRRFRVSLVYVDYTADIGLVTTTWDQYTRIWKDTLVDSYGIYLAKGTAADPVRDRIVRDYGARYGLMVLENQQYQDELLKLIDRSFALTRAMELVAIIVAVLGIVNTLLVAVIDRRMEIGILKAIGAGGAQVRTMFVTEASLIGFSATLVGVGFGTVFSVYIVRELLMFQTGWRMDYRFPLGTVVEVFLVAQVVAVLGAWWPARRAARIDVVDALEYE
ncbi:MAG TPA: FtsX-like permease family protein [bacterium]|nr:FtsX-like permease family protein [bacterium]